MEGPRNIQLNTAPSTAMRPTSLLIFGGCLVVCVHGQKTCGTNEYPISDYPHGPCMPCDKCHEGYGLEPRCGTAIIYQVDKTECRPCPPQKFNDKYDSSSCMNCHRCAEHEIVAKQCTNKSDTVCSGTCEEGFYFSKKDGTHSCQKCSYCCDEESDEEVPDCKNQGFSDTKQYCSPRPDKDCSPAALSTPPTEPEHGSKGSKDNKPSSAKFIAIGVFGTIIIIVAVVAVIWVYHRRRKRSVSTGQRQAATHYASHGPMTEQSVQYSGNRSSEVDNGVCGAQQNAVALNQDTSNDQTIRSTASLTNAEASKQVPSGESVPPCAHDTVHNGADKVATDVNVYTRNGKNDLSRQTSRDSQKSGDGGDAGSRKRSPSTTSLKETLKRKLSARKEDALVHNEEEDMDAMQGPIKIEQEPVTQEAKEGSKVEFVFKCKVGDVNSTLTYQWFKDGTELPENEATLRLKPVMLRDFGCYKCHASCKDSPVDVVESSPADLDVTPRDGTRYKYLSEVDFKTMQKVETLLTHKRYSLGGWRQVAFKYGMDQLDIKSLESDPEAGSKTVEFLDGKLPYLTVYDFCKTLKGYDIRRQDIVKELLDHLSIPGSSKVYL